MPAWCSIPCGVLRCAYQLYFGSALHANLLAFNPLNLKILIATINCEAHHKIDMAERKYHPWMRQKLSLRAPPALGFPEHVVAQLSCKHVTRILRVDLRSQIIRHKVSSHTPQWHTLHAQRISNEHRSMVRATSRIAAPHVAPAPQHCFRTRRSKRSSRTDNHFTPTLLQLFNRGSRFF